MKHHEWAVLLKDTPAGDRAKQVFDDWTADSLRQQAMRKALAEALEAVYKAASDEFYAASMVLLDYAKDKEN